MKKQKLLFIFTACLTIITIFLLIDRYKYIPYDVNKDGKVDVLDLLKIQKYILNEKNERKDKNEN